MTNKEKSVDEIVEASQCDAGDVVTGWVIQSDEVRNILKTERQKRDEMVRVERKNSHYTGYSKALLEVEQWHINDKSLTGKVKNMLKALNQPNNPNV